MAEQPKPKTVRKLVPKAPDPAYAGPPTDPAVAAAFQALVRGECPAHLQQKAINFLIYDACKTYEPAFRPGAADAERETTFALGKQFVGQLIVGLLKVKVNKEGDQ